MITIGKKFEFAAAHRLGRHEGKCRNPHGHNYVLEIDLTGPNQMEGSGQHMILDYYIVKQIIEREIMQRFDHKDLNVEILKFWPDSAPEEDNITTAENLVALFAQILGPAFYDAAPHAILSRLRLQETPGSWVEWRPEANNSGVFGAPIIGQVNY